MREQSSVDDGLRRILSADVWWQSRTCPNAAHLLDGAPEPSGWRQGPLPRLVCNPFDDSNILALLTFAFGSVSNFHVETATLTLQHHYPACSTPVAAAVNIDLTLSTLKATDTQIGEWINIMGYITGRTQSLGVGSRKTGEALGMMVSVQAIMLWSAGSIKLGEYERTLDERKEVEIRLMSQAG